MTDPVRRYAALDDLWQRKLDEVVALSTAYAGTASVADDAPADPAVVPSVRLRDRATRAFEELAAIEDALARVDDGTYGLCTACHQRMPEDWLAEEPQVQICPDCSLILVTQGSSRARPATQPPDVVPVRAAVPHPASADRAPVRAVTALPCPA